MSAQAATKPLRLDPCPAEERISEYDALPDEYKAFTHQAVDHEGSDEKSGVSFQKCGGGRRVIRKKIGGQ